MKEISLSEILEAREARVRLQAEVSKNYRCPLISFTMNIAGPIKNTPLVSRAFHLGIEHLDAALSKDKILLRHIEADKPTGPFAIYAVKESAHLLKRICVEAEEKTALGRLFDMDVINEDFEKLTRHNERCCVICGAVGRACAAGRVHSVSELQRTMNRIMEEQVLRNDSKRIADLAVQSLIREVMTTPKPGLVDLRNNGSHTDMTVKTFERSAYALEDYFLQCMETGKKNAVASYGELLSSLRNAGKAAELRMYDATGGVNTHKGAIYSFGILCGSIGRIWTPERPIPDVSVLFREATNIARVALESDFSKASHITAGERIYTELGITGIRGEAASGFASVYETALPAYRALRESGFDPNSSGVITLIHLIARIDDTTLYNRGGKQALRFAKEYAKKVLAEEKYPKLKRIEQMDDEFIQRNLSAGGSADLLAVTYFIDELEKLFDDQGEH